MLELKKLDLKFIGEDGKHIHLLNGQEVPGCTSISGLFPEDGWKFAWPVKLMEEKLMEEYEHGFEPGNRLHKWSGLKASIKKAKNAWREKRDKAADTGTAGHLWIQKYIEAEMKRQANPDIFLTPEFADNYPTAPTDEEIKNIVTEFFTWESITKPKWIASELQVASETHKFAGILDALAVIDSKLILVDFKTSSAIKDDYNIQLAGLMICLEEMGCKPDGRAILHLPKEGKYEYRVIDSNLEEEKIDFLAGLAFYHRKNLWKARNK